MGTSPIGQDTAGPGIAARYPEGLIHQGISAELIAAKWKLDRETLDAYSAESHRRAAAAAANGLLRRRDRADRRHDADRRDRRAHRRRDRARLHHRRGTGRA